MKIKWKLGNRDIYIKRQVQLNLMLSTSYSYSFLETLGSRSKFKNIRKGTIVQYLLKKTHQESLGGWIWRRDSYNEWPLEGQFSWNLPGLRSRVPRLL